MMVLHFGLLAARSTGRRDRIEMRLTEGCERRVERTAEPTRPVAPVRMMCWLIWRAVVVISGSRLGCDIDCGCDEENMK